MSKAKKTILLIMDGWGIGQVDEDGQPDKFDAIAQAKTPNYDRLIREYPNVSLFSHGEYVGLPTGQYGTSEVNHLVIGSGRVVPQPLVQINQSIESGYFFDNDALNQAVRHAQQHNSNLHLAGIISDGGVHSSLEHVVALLQLIKKREFGNKVFIHVFTDGRDTAPKSAQKYLTQLQQKCNELGLGRIATLQGRFYLDRNRDWDKTEKAYQLLTKGQGVEVQDWQEAVRFGYNQFDTDEYLPQYLIDQEGVVQASDSLLFFHYRTDRILQILTRFAKSKLPDLHITSFVEASAELDVAVAFPKENVPETLAEVLAAAGKSQLHVTETEKYPHLTYFFDGRREQEYPQESWLLHPSNRFVKPFYNVEPSMQNFVIADSVIAEIGKGDEASDFIVANLSSPDMVGHTGNFHAAVISAESIDFCLGKIYEAIAEQLDEYALLITADHGNSEQMWDYDNDQPHTQHTMNKVPLILVSDINQRLARRESLEDIAPTIIDLMGLSKPSVMSGESLL